MKYVAATAVLCSFLLVPAFAGASNSKNVTKYTFPSVSYGDPFPDGSGLIRASTKLTNKGTDIVCGYFLEPNDQYLGQFQAVNSADFPGTDPGAVETFCLNNFSNRSD